MISDFDPKRKTILIIEDDKQMQATQEKFIKTAGYNVIVAENGQDGVDKCGRQKFDLILCDITMPKMSGDVAIEQIRKSDLNAETPIVVLSGHLDLEVVRRIKGKVSRAFTKPADMMEVCSFIGEVLNG